MSWRSPDGGHYRARRRCPTLLTCTRQSRSKACTSRTARRGRARHRLTRRSRRGVLAARPQRSRQDDDRRDPRGHRRRTAGEVTVLGHDPGAGERALKERIGIVLQSPAIQPYLTVEEKRRCALSRLLPAPAAARRNPRGRWPHRAAGVARGRLSGGQQRRLDVAVGLAGDPELLFLDEPTTGFDPSARRQAWEMVKNLQALGKTIFLTTHYMDEAQYLADRVKIMDRGRIVALGTPAEIGGRDTAPTEIALRAARRRRARRPAHVRRRAHRRAGRRPRANRHQRRPAHRARASPAGHSSAATSCADSPSASRRWRTSTFD